MRVARIFQKCRNHLQILGANSKSNFWESQILYANVQNLFYVFFWVFPRRPIVVCRRFGTLYQFHLQRLDVEYLHPALEDGTDRGFQNVGKPQSDAGEIPKEYIQYSKHGESLKSRVQNLVATTTCCPIFVHP